MAKPTVTIAKPSALKAAPAAAPAAPKAIAAPKPVPMAVKPANAPASAPATVARLNTPIGELADVKKLTADLKGAISEIEKLKAANVALQERIAASTKGPKDQSSVEIMARKRRSLPSDDWRNNVNGALFQAYYFNIGPEENLLKGEIGSFPTLLTIPSGSDPVRPKEDPAANLADLTQGHVHVYCVPGSEDNTFSGVPSSIDRVTLMAILNIPGRFVWKDESGHAHVLAVGRYNGGGIYQPGEEWIDLGPALDDDTAVAIGLVERAEPEAASE
jgi:hypothetical protein